MFNWLSTKTHPIPFSLPARGRARGGSAFSFRNPKSKGFTLVEIVITIVIVSIIAAIAAAILLQGVQAYVAEGERSDVHYRARLAIERMAREIRLIRDQGTDIITMTPSSLQFTDINGSNTGFTWAASTLYRWNGTGNDTLATGITSFAFSYLQQDGVSAATPADVWYIDIALTSRQGAESLVMRSRVHPRNFQ